MTSSVFRISTPRRKLSPQFESCIECAICLSDFEKGDKVLVLPCGHIFHQVEIVPWLIESKRLCPTCRSSITVDESVVAPSIEVPSSTPTSTVLRVARENN